MLSSISWPHYFEAVVIITASYYLYIVFRYYQTEFNGVIHRKQRSAELFVRVKSEPFQVMGQAKPDNGITVTDSQDLRFDAASPDDEDISVSEIKGPINSEETPFGLAKELVQEAVNLIKAYKGIDNKLEFLALLKILIDPYKEFKHRNDLTSTLNEIVESSKDELMFPVSLADLQGICA